MRAQLTALKADIDAIPAGPAGPAGPPGPMGEVSSTDVTNAIANAITGTARHPNTVSDLVLMPNNPPTQEDLLAVIAKLNELLNALRR